MIYIEKRIMNYAIRDIIDVLKSVRKAKGLSQKALSKRTGVPQSHISKIESGGADIRLSSLIELARALDLDLRLIPRKAVPAVEHIVRGAVPSTPAPSALKEINRTLDIVRNLRSVYPDVEVLTKLQSDLQAFKNLDNIDKRFETLREVTKSVRELQKLTEASNKLTEVAKLRNEQLKEIQRAVDLAQKFHDQLVRGIPEQRLSRPRPAYCLNDYGEEDRG